MSFVRNAIFPSVFDPCYADGFTAITITITRALKVYTGKYTVSKVPPKIVQARKDITIPPSRLRI